MKITETIERDCCHQKDLLPYKGVRSDILNYGKNLQFCRHCGQIWFWERKMDEAGSGADYLVKMMV
jgi:hypothetical protein